MPATSANVTGGSAGLGAVVFAGVTDLGRPAIFSGERSD